MNNALKHLLLILFITIAFDILLGLISPIYIKSIETGLIGRTNKSLKTNADCIILGSSRALHHYNSEIIANILKVSCQNVGMNGYGLFYNYALLSGILENHYPKTIILDISPNVVTYKESLNKLGKLYPLKNIDAFSEIINLFPGHNIVLSKSNIYCLNSTVYNMFSSIVKRDDDSINFGLIGKIDTLNTDFYSIQDSVIDPLKIRYFKKIIEICKSNNINLYCFISPTFAKVDKKDLIINQFKEISEENGILFFDYSDYSQLYKNPIYFKDKLHLNRDGANIYSITVSKVLNKINNKSI